jgi:uncharacterized protein (DUF305 family)
VRRPFAPVVVLAALAAGAASPGAALAQASHGHHGHAAMSMPAPAKAPPGQAIKGQPPLYTADDLAFLQHMIMHHQQAVAMGALMEGRAEHPELIRFAGLVADAQRAEIAAMQGLHDLAAARGLSAPEHHMHGDPPMAGMLSQAELTALAAAKGPAFERLWLQGMMFHHEGGLAMARAQELRQALDGRQPDQLAVMVDDILVTQRAEIGIMNTWLTDWGLAQAGDQRAPTAQVQSPSPDAAVRVGAPLTVFGVAVDDTGVASVDAAIHDLAKDRWLRRDGTWGAREARTADLIGSGPASAAWRLDFTPPAPGRYALTVEATDTAGKRTAAAEAWTVEAR